jgi:DNA-binding transcriptional ArsR family regulator
LKRFKLMDETQVIRALGALSQTHRLKAFRALVVAGPQGLTPGRLCEQLGISPASMSFHLRELLAAGLVSQTRDGRNLVYCAAFGHMNALMAYLSANCCEGQPCALDAPVCHC